MRNLEHYPITTDEIVQCLKDLMDGVAYEKTGLVGDMRPLLLANAIQLISANAPAQQAPRCDRCGSSGDIFMMCAGCQSPLTSTPSEPAQRVLDEEVYRGLQEARVILDRIISAGTST